MDVIECLEYVTENYDEITAADKQGNDAAHWLLRAVELIDQEGMDVFYVSMFASYTQKYKLSKS